MGSEMCIRDRNIDGIPDVGIVEGKIAMVGERIAEPSAEMVVETVDLTGRILTPGWIDIHAHL